MEVEISLLPVTGCICLLVSIFEGWIMALIRYLKIKPLIKIFPGYRYLVRSHIDYVMMSILLFVIYLTLLALEVSISKLAISALIVGALYNPSGFILQAINPEIAEGNSKLIKFGTLAGFIPTTYGFCAVCLAIICKIV